MRRGFASWLPDVFAGQVARHLEHQFLLAVPGAELGKVGVMHAAGRVYRRASCIQRRRHLRLGGMALGSRIVRGTPGQSPTVTLLLMPWL